MNVEANVVAGITGSLEPASVSGRARNAGDTIGVDHSFRLALHMSLAPHGSRRSRAGTHQFDGTVSRQMPTGDFLPKQALPGSW